MKFKHLALPEVMLFEPQLHQDERGFFMESFHRERMEQALGRSFDWVQDNHSSSVKGVLRGLHFQRLWPQGKLVRVVVGQVFDVAVDIRPGSPTFGRWVSALLSAENKHQLWIPEGFAHGFYVLSERAELLYKTTAYYLPDQQGQILWNDPDLAIDWPLQGEPILSAQDQKAPRLAQAEH